jgi:hypothetical protein
MEAMRLSLLEHEAQQRREAEQRAQNGAEESSSRSRTESQNLQPSPPAAETSSTDVAGSTTASTLTPLALSNSPSSSPSDLSNASSPNAPPVPESPPNGSDDIHHSRRPSSQPSPSPTPTPSPPTVSRMDSFASSVSTRETDSVSEGYRFLTSESEDSVVAREPLLHLEESDA